MTLLVLNIPSDLLLLFDHNVVHITNVLFDIVNEYGPLNIEEIWQCVQVQLNILPLRFIFAG